MKITVLLENTACRADCRSEHGLSMFVELDDMCLLFDMGQSGMFADNAAVLGIDLDRADAAVLSHGHYDHGGGISRFLGLNSRAKVYMSQYAFGQHYSGAEKYIGLDPALAEEPRLVPVTDEMYLAQGVKLIPWGEHPCAHPSGGFGLNRMEGEQLVPDDFRHEQYLLVERGGKRVLFSGCSHKGILNIMERFRPDVLVGGFHFMKIDTDADGKERLLELGRRLMEFDAEYYTCHCTGTEQYEVLRGAMGDRLHYAACGAVIEL